MPTRRLVTRVGDDDLGREVLERFRSLGLPTETVQVDPAAPTGTVDVALAPDGQPRYTIRRDVAWDRIEADEPALARASRADAVCFGSLAQRDEPSRARSARSSRPPDPDALRVFDVNLRPPFVDRDVIADSLELANALKLNDQELPELAAMFGIADGRRARRWRRWPAGSGSRSWPSRAGPGGACCGPTAPGPTTRAARSRSSDTIGAGDAFTAALVVGRLAGRPLDAINRHANEVAAFVCSRPGGTPALPDALKLPTPRRPGGPPVNAMDTAPATADARRPAASLTGR